MSVTGRTFVVAAFLQKWIKHFCVTVLLVTSCRDRLLQVCNVVESLRRGHHGRREARPDVHELVLAARDAHQQLWSRHALRLLARVRANTLIKLNCTFLSVRALKKLVLIRQVLRQSDHAGATARTALPRIDRHRELRVLVSLLQMPQQYCDTSRASAALAQHQVCVMSYRVTLFSSCDVYCISAMSPSWSCRWATG